MWKDKQNPQIFSDTYQVKKRQDSVIKIRNEGWDITTDITQKLRFISDYYEWLCKNKIKNLKEIDTFLET